MAGTSKKKKGQKKQLFYRIGEACKQLDIQPYVLRYWETEFPVLDPDKSKSGQRVYSEKDIDLIRRIKELLYEEGYTIAGAKKRLEEELSATDGEIPPPGTPVGAVGGLDTSDDDQIERVFAEIRQAIAEGREILALLEPSGDTE